MVRIFGMGELMHKPPETNWGSVALDDGQPPADIWANATLAKGVLTEQDRELFELLELGTHHRWVTPGIQSAFSQLMRPGNVSELGPQRFIEWIEYLLRFVPAYNPQWTAADYDKAGYSRPLLAFYIVTLRSGFWPVRYGMMDRKSGEITDLHPDPVTLFLDPASRQWDAHDFVLRHDLITWNMSFGGSRQLWEQIETLTRVAAIVVPPLRQFLSEYDAWAHTFRRH